MKKFLSDVLVDCNLTVSGSSTLGTATGVTVSAGDNSTALATTEWVTTHVSTNSIYSLRVPVGTTTIRLASSSTTEDVAISATGSVAVSRVSDSEIRLTGTNNYLSSASFSTSTGVLTLGREGLSNITVDLDNRYLTSESDTLDTVTSRDGVTTNTIGVGTVNVIGTTAGQELLTVDGTNGRLFTVTDDLSDSLFSVNTIAGLPVIEVFADNTIKLGNFANPIEIDSSANIVIPGTITASGYNDSNWNTAFNDRITAASVSGTSTKTLTLTQGDGSTITASWTDIEGSGADGYVSDVALNGNSLDFTAVGSGFAGSIDLSTITTDLTSVETVYSTVRNVSGGPIEKGTPLAVVPGQTSGNVSDVIPADASDPSRMPAVFIANEDIANGVDGQAVIFGEITGVDTSAYDSGVTVYVARGGGWTVTKPDGDALIQNLGIITKVHPSNGAGVVMGAGRSNDVPNIPTGYAWVGNANGVATPTLLGSLAFSSAIYDNYVSWNLKTNNVQRTTVGSGGTLDIVAGSNVSVAYGAGGVVTISSTDTNTDTNNYVTGLSFNTGNGVLTATREGLGDLTVDLDGRYASSSHNHDTRYIRKDVVDSFTGLTNDVYDDTPGFLKGVISLRPGSEGGTTGIGFSTTVNVNTETGQDYGYLWWYDDNNNYAFGNGSGENAALILGIQNDSSTTDFGGTQDAIAIESSANIFLNPGLSGIGTGGVGGPDFSKGKVYIGRADEAYEIYHQGNLVNVSQLNNDAGYLTEFTETLTELSLASNILSYRDETGAVTELDLSLYLDDTNLARLTSGTLDSNTGIATFSRDDSSTFTVDFSALFDDVDNYVDSVAFSTSNGVLTIGRTGSLANLTVDLDGRYLATRSDIHGTLYSTGGNADEYTQFGIYRNYGEGQPEGLGHNTLLHVSQTDGKYGWQITSSTSAGGDSMWYRQKGADWGEGTWYQIASRSWVSSQSYLTSYTETDPIFTASAAAGITATNISNWNTAFGWGDHDGLYDAAGTAASEAGAVNTRIDEEVLPLIQTPAITSNGSTPSLNTGISAAEVRTLIGAGTSSTDTNFYLSGASFNTTTGVLTLTVSGATDQTVDLDGRYLTSFTETDPVFSASPAGGISAQQIVNWDEAHGWGNHADSGYLTSVPAEYVTATEITNYSINPRFGSTIGMGNDSAVIQFQDSNAYTKAGYWSTLDAVLINGDSNSNNNIILRTGNILVNQNQFISGKLGVQGVIELGDDASTTIYRGVADGDPAPVVIETFDAAKNIGAFIDFTIYDDAKGNMRSGTLQLVFNADQVMFNEVNTMDIGDTNPCTLDAVNNAGTIDVRFTTPDPTFHIKYHVRTL